MRSFFTSSVLRAGLLATSASTSAQASTGQLYRIYSSLECSAACRGSHTNAEMHASHAPTSSGANFGTSMHSGNLPQLCATPKKKLSVYRRGNRRVWYWLKRKPEFAKCSFCGAHAGRNDMFSGSAGNSLCNGRCLEHPKGKVEYPAEYQPPC